MAISRKIDARGKFGGTALEKQYRDRLNLPRTDRDNKHYHGIDGSVAAHKHIYVQLRAAQSPITDH